MREQNDGFTFIELMLVVVILGLIGGTGYYVWNVKQNTESALKLNTSDNSNAKKARAPNEELSNSHIFKIPAWGVQAINSSDDTFTVSVNVIDGGGYAEVGSLRLSRLYGADCATSGAGEIIRAKADQKVTDDGLTGAEFAAQYPQEASHIGEYYYRYVHSQGACGDDISQQAADDQNEANARLKAMVHSFTALD